MKWLLLEKRREQVFLLSLMMFSVGPLVRWLVVGMGPSKNIFEYVFSNLPELLFGFFLIMNLRSLQECFNRRRLELIIYLYIILTSSVTALYTSFDEWMSVFYGFKMTYFPMLIFFVMSVQKKYILKVWNAYVVVYTFFSILFHFFCLDVERRFVQESGHAFGEYFIPRMGGFLFTPVPFSMMLSFSVIYYIVKILRGEDKWKYWLFLVLLMTGLSFSVTRTGILGIIAVSFFLMLRTKEYWKVIRIIVMFIVIFVIVMNGSFKALYWLGDSTKETLSMNERVSRVKLWKGALKEFLESPILGHGMGHAGAGAIKYFSKDSQNIKASVHSTDGWYFKELNELGLINFVLLVFFFYRSINKDIFGEDVYIFELSVLLFVMISSVFNNLLDFFPLNALVYLIVSKNEKDVC